MAFWDPWETWAKMTFILACSIGAVLIFSLGVRWRNKRRIKKYSERTSPDRTERGEMAQASSQGEEVPFGIRAIERGCEIDGVWNSKASTPLQTPGNSNPGSPAMRPKDLGNGLLSLQKHRRELSLSMGPPLELPQPALARPDPVPPETSTDTTSEARSAEDGESTPNTSPDRQLSMRGRRAYQPKPSFRSIPYPPSAYPQPSSSRCISYPPSASQPSPASKHRSYPPSLPNASALSSGKYGGEGEYSRGAIV